MPSISDTAIGAAIGSAITLLVKEGIPHAWKAYKKRRIDPKKEHRQVLLDGAAWFQDRANKLNALRVKLTYETTAPDRFRLAEMISKLDKQDREWSMKLAADMKLLCDQATLKAQECEENAAQSSILAADLDRHTLL